MDAWTNAGSIRKAVRYAASALSNLPLRVSCIGGDGGKPVWPTPRPNARRECPIGGFTRCSAIAVNSLAPTGIVASPGVLFHKLIKDDTDPRAEPIDYMAKATLILATCDPKTLTGRVAYSQPLLKEHGQL